MTGYFTVDTKVIHAADQPLAKQVVPDAVDKDSRREWIAGIREPVRELQTTAGLFWDVVEL